VFESSGAPDIADMLGITEPTVRTHLRRLFEKTGTKRQPTSSSWWPAFPAPIYRRWLSKMRTAMFLCSIFDACHRNG
jgi:DNA-binding NarL/FixJ family response regulator